jgi:hypothetical protein
MGSVSRQIGLSADRNSSAVVPGTIGPTPDEPAIVM